MPRLAIAFEFPTISGGERSMLAVLGSAVPAGWDVVALAPPSGPMASALQQQGVPVEPLDLRENGNKPPPDFAAEMLASSVARVRPDVLHANSLSMSRTAGRLAKQTGGTTTGHIRDIVKLSRAAIGDVNANRLLLCVSQATRDYHVAQGLDPSLAQVVYNGIEVEPSRAAARGWLRHDLGLANDTQLIATIGQICLRKGHDLAAQALTSLGDLDWRWLIIGERFSQKAESVAFEESIADILRQAGLEDRLIRLGYRDDMPDIYREIDVVLHCARQEPLGRVLLEACAYGVPIVATDVGGSNEIIGDRTSLLPPTDHAAIIGRLRQMLREPSSHPLHERFSLSAATSNFWHAIQSIHEQGG